MPKSYYKIICLTIIIISLAAAIFVEPKFFNQGVDYLNNKFHWSLPSFWERPFQVGLDLKGGVELLYEADLSQIKEADHEQAMQGLRDVIERRVNIFGVKEAEIEATRAGFNYRLRIRIPGITDPEAAIKEIGKTPYLEFQESKPDFLEIQQRNREALEKGEGQLESPFQPTGLTGRYLEKAVVDFSQTTYEPEVSLQFNEEGAKIFEDLTGRNIGKPLAIFIDNNLLSAPTVKDKISGGRAQITGQFTVQEAQKLASNLNAGALPVPIGDPISQTTVGPNLGLVSLQKSLKAGFYGLVAIVLFMVIIYKLPGLMASIALLIYGIFLLTLFKAVPITLTLAGIGGFILSLGMAVDANVLIFARMREELRSGKELGLAIEEGFRRAWPSIRDSNLTTLIVAMILFGVGTSFVKGFATTLSIGVLMSMFSAMVVTRTFLTVLYSTKIGKIKKIWS